jgi:hypothetical protein
LLGHPVVASLRRDDRKRQECLVVVGVEVERLMEAGLGSLEFTDRPMQHAHQKEDPGAGAGGLLASAAQRQCLGMSASIGKGARLAEHIVNRRQK